jgi:hypothetical protein
MKLRLELLVLLKANNHVRKYPFQSNLCFNLESE